MDSKIPFLGYGRCLDHVRHFIEEPGDRPVLLISGPRQVGKTSILLELAARFDDISSYASADSPASASRAAIERLLAKAEEVSRSSGKGVLLLDEVHLVPGWEGMIIDIRARSNSINVVIIAAGSSCMIDLTGDKGGRREAVVQVTLPHWSLESLVDTFEIGPADAAEMYVRMGAYPGAFRMADTPSKWGSFIRDAVIEPSIGRDALSLGDVRRPGLLRQLFWAAVSHPAEIVTLQRLQQELPGRPAMETIAHYLSLLEKAWIVAVIKKYSTMSDKKRSSPPKIVALSNALLAAADPKAIPDPARDPARWDAWLRNACIARACNAGQHVSYWRAEPLSADMVVEGSWGRWVVDVRTGPLPPAALRGLAAFTRRFPGFTPLLVGDAAACASAAGAAVRTARWQDYLLGGLPPRQDDAGEARPTPRDDEAPPPRAGRLEPHLL